MTEEEKKAVEFIKKEIKNLEEAKIEFSNEIEDKGWLQKNINELDKDIFYKNTLLNLIERLKKEITNGMEREENLKDSLIEIIETLNLENNVVSQETILQEIVRLQTENEELKNKVAKRNNELIELEETSEKEFLTKQEVKENYIPKELLEE